MKTNTSNTKSSKQETSHKTRPVTENDMSSNKSKESVMKNDKNKKGSK